MKREDSAVFMARFRVVVSLSVLLLFQSTNAFAQGTHEFGVLPAWGEYIRHARNVEFKNVELRFRG